MFLANYFLQNFFESQTHRFRVNDEEEERGKQNLIKKEPEVAPEKNKKGVKSKKNYQTDYEGAMDKDQEMIDEGGLVKDQRNQEEIKNEVEDERIRKHGKEKDQLL